MAEKIDLQGQCLCGSVKVSLAQVKSEIGACHCVMCQQWSGGPFLSVEASAEQIQIEGTESMTVFASSEWAERAFCQRCGSNLFYRLKQTQAHFVLAGLFGGDERLQLDHQIYIDQKPIYYNFRESTPMLTGAQVEAMFGVSEPG